MKNLIQTAVNLWFWLYYDVIFSFAGVIWYGKLPKVSTYHRVTRQDFYSLKSIYNDINAQVLKTDDVPTHIKDKVIEEYLDALMQDIVFRSNVLSIDIPMFDGKEVIGTSGIYPLLNEVKTKHLNK